MLPKINPLKNILSSLKKSDSNIDSLAFDSEIFQDKNYDYALLSHLEKITSVQKQAKPPSTRLYTEQYSKTLNNSPTRKKHAQKLSKQAKTLLTNKKDLLEQKEQKLIKEKNEYRLMQFRDRKIYDKKLENQKRSRKINFKEESIQPATMLMSEFWNREYQMKVASTYKKIKSKYNQKNQSSKDYSEERSASLDFIKNEDVKVFSGYDKKSTKTLRLLNPSKTRILQKQTTFENFGDLGLEKVFQYLNLDNKNVSFKSFKSSRKFDSLLNSEPNRQISRPIRTKSKLTEFEPKKFMLKKKFRALKIKTPEMNEDSLKVRSIIENCRTTRERFFDYNRGVVKNLSARNKSKKFDRLNFREGKVRKRSKKRVEEFFPLMQDMIMRYRKKQRKIEDM